MCSERKVCLVLLVGIPGSGKSIFRTFFENYFKTNFESILGSVQMCCVSYDDYSKVRNPNQLCDGNTWKAERLGILKVVQNIIMYFRDNKSKNVNISFPEFSVINGNVENPDSILLLIDDNMYYRSMRYEYFKVARTCNLSFCQVFFDVTLEEALKNNKRRSSALQVPDSIIETMFDKIEPPQKNHSWEISSTCVSTNTNFQNKCVLDTILTCIRNALLNPVKCTEMYAHKEEAQRVTSSNALHQIDNTLKKLVGFCITNKIKGNNNSEPFIISQYYSKKRLAILKEIKEGNIILPIDLTKPINLENIELIIPMLSNLLQN